LWFSFVTSREYISWLNASFLSGSCNSFNVVSDEIGVSACKTIAWIIVRTKKRFREKKEAVIETFASRMIKIQIQVLQKIKIECAAAAAAAAIILVLNAKT
jgi:hypothetical protein